jgi:hypothetical protein
MSSIFMPRLRKFYGGKDRKNAANGLNFLNLSYAFETLSILPDAGAASGPACMPPFWLLQLYRIHPS